MVAAAEIGSIVLMSKWIGGWPTFALIVLTAACGVWLTMSEGRKVWADAARQLSSGQMPGWAILDGLCVLAGGLLLIVPGFLSDLAGISMLVPFTRRLYRLLLFGWLERKIRTGQWTIRFGARK